MPQLPETGLSGLFVADHVTHHETLHGLNNRITETTSAVGDALVRSGTGQTLADFEARNPDYVWPAQTRTHYHYTTGPLTFTVDGEWLRAIRVVADSPIQGLSITNLESRGPTFAQIWVLLEVITQTITIDLSPATIVGGAPATMAAGTSIPFLLQRWNIT